MQGQQVFTDDGKGGTAARVEKKDVENLMDSKVCVHLGSSLLSFRRYALTKLFYSHILFQEKDGANILGTNGEGDEMMVPGKKPGTLMYATVRVRTC